MPRFKGSCGCYNRDDARRFGVVPAIVWNDMLDRAEHFNANPMWYDQCDASERLGIPRQTINRAVKTLEEAGRINTKIGYRPNTTVTTTWVTINAEESELCDNLDAQNEHPKDAQNEHPIYKDTNKTDSLGDADDDIIPKADVTMPFIEVTIYDSDDDCKTITVKHQVAPKDWNRAVNKWRKDPGAKVMLPLKDTGETEQMTFRRIKKYNLRPKKTNAMGYDRSSGTQFKVNL